MTLDDIAADVDNLADAAALLLAQAAAAAVVRGIRDDMTAVAGALDRLTAADVPWAGMADLAPLTAAVERARGQAATAYAAMHRACRSRLVELRAAADAAGIRLAMLDQGQG